MSGSEWDLLSSYAGLLALATGSICIGAFGSLPHPKGEKGEDGQLLEEDDDEILERLSSGDAWIFPILGSITLLGLYTIVKYYGKDWINWFLGWYFSIIGIGSVGKSLISFARFCVGRARWQQFEKTHLSLTKGSKSLFSLSWRTPSMVLFPIAAMPSVIYSISSAKQKSVLITDILSLSFAHNGLSLLRLDSFGTGSILLSGLFVYDIWWVFGTEVMVKVATTLDIPIKLLWPKSIVFSGVNGYTMLGLGDVMIPGTFIALALRYDYYRSVRTKSAFKKPFFFATLIAYILGLGTSFFVLNIFGKAQPALLYLSPACIAAFLVTASARGELREVLEWSDQPEEKGKEKKAE